MILKEIIVEYLVANGFDGLYLDDCGCMSDDLMPCGEPSPRCSPGYLNPDEGDGWIGPEMAKL